MVQGEVALLRAETPPPGLDPGGAARRGDPDAAPDHGLARGEPAGHRPAQGRSLVRSVQHPAAAGAAPGAHRPEPAAAQRAAHPARGARRADREHRAAAAPRRPGRHGPADRCPPSASADQMYEASLAQLRRGSTGTARLGLREMLRTYPTSPRAPDALYFIGQSFAAENPDSAAAYYGQVVDKYPTSARAPSALYNLGLARRAAGKTAPRRRTPTSAWCRSIPSPTRRRWPRSLEGARAVSPGAAAA